MRNTFGSLLTLTTFGESHGPAIGGVLDGLPPSLPLDLSALQFEMSRRRPGQSRLTTSRQEPDTVRILSGVFDGFTTGTPLAFAVENTNQHSHDYASIQHIFRPSHADYVYHKKYGVRDHRGGGRASARETAARVAGGAIAKQILKGYGISVGAYTSQVGEVRMENRYEDYKLEEVESNDVRCPEAETAKRMEAVILEAKNDRDTVGGVVTGIIKGLPAGVGEPVFDRLQARLAAAMMSINAAKGFDYGDGFDIVGRRGSEVNDIFYKDEAGKIRTRTNHSGGIQGGISNGEDIYFRVAFKPVATLLKPQMTVDDEGNEVEFCPTGRHDPCVVPRAVPIVEAMAALTVLDMYLIYKAYK